MRANTTEIHPRKGLSRKITAMYTGVQGVSKKAIIPFAVMNWRSVVKS